MNIRVSDVVIRNCLPSKLFRNSSASVFSMTIVEAYQVMLELVKVVFCHLPGFPESVDLSLNLT
jgi:hypothetical protein